MAFKYQWPKGYTTPPLAIPALEQIAADSEHFFGPGHEDTLAPRTVLALTYWKNGPGR